MLPLLIPITEAGRIALLLVLWPLVLFHVLCAWVFELLFPPVPRWWVLVCAIFAWVWDDGAENNRKKIDLEDLHFPREFKWGVATAAHQIEGNCNNNTWWRFEHSTRPDGNPTILDGQKSGLACDSWNRGDEDIRLLRELNVTSYRFSVEWSKIEPSQGKYSADALQHYSVFIDKLIENGIEPMITLHHFSEPIWFADLGSFEKEENIELFVNFCQRVFELYGTRVKYWCTFNEPSVYMAVGYISGAFPPGKNSIQLGVQVMRNLLDAHVRVYYALKSMPAGLHAQIGIVKNMFCHHPYRWWNPIDRLMAAAIEHLQNESILEFFRTGYYRIRLGWITMDYHNPKAMLANDFIGLNYYSQFQVCFNPFGKVPICMMQDSRDEMTDMNYPIYAEGFYKCIKRVSQLHLPIIVTENGVADKSDRIRKLFLQKYLYALSKAMAEGADVRGYYHWTLVDNFEWNSGFHLKFGFYSMDRNTFERTLRPSGRWFADLVRKFRHEA